MSLSPTMRTLRYSPTWRPSLVTHLHGQTIIVPDLLRIYTATTTPTASTPLSPSPLLRSSMSTWIDTYIDTSRKRAKLYAADIPQCATNFWPSVEPARQHVLGAYLAWFFVWDDEVDCGSLVGNQKGIEKYGADSIAYIRQRLSRQGSHGAIVHGEGDTPAGRNCAVWNDIGQALSQGQSVESRDRFAASLYAYMAAVCTPRSPSTVPPCVSTYLSRRRLTIGSTPILCLHLWAHKLSLPSWVWDLDATTRIIDAVALGISLVNDIASLKKEVDNEEVESIVPLMMLQEGCSVQEAVEMAVQMVRQGWGDFVAARQEITGAVDGKGESEQVKRDVKKFVKACEDVLVGNVEYHLRAPRYTKGMVFEQGGFGYMLTL